MTLHTSLRSFIVIAALLLSSTLAATEKSSCLHSGEPLYPGGESTADIGNFLDCEYKGTQSKLKKKITDLIAVVSQSSSWSLRPDGGIKDRAQIISAIRDADKYWRLMTNIECRTLVGDQYYGGSGQDNYIFQCLLDRTNRRIKYLEEDDTYKDYWKQ